MKFMLDDCFIILFSVLYQNGFFYDKCVGSGVIIIFLKIERKEIFEYFCFVFVFVFVKICK